MTLIQTKQKRAAREQRNKYKPRTETSTNQEQKQEQHLPIRHAGRPADLYIHFGDVFIVYSPGNHHLFVDDPLITRVYQAHGSVAG